MLLIYALGRYQLTVTTRTRVWQVSFERFELDAWTRLDISWQAEAGIVVYVNGNFIARSIEAIRRDVVISADIVVKNKVVIGQSIEISTKYQAAIMVVEDIKFFFATIEECESAGLVRIGKYVYLTFYVFVNLSINLLLAIDVII